MVDGVLGGGDAMLGRKGPDFVEVLFASSEDEATRCCDFLNRAAIPARLESGSYQDDALGIAVLIPPEKLAQASEILASRVNHAVDEEEGDDDYVDEDDDEEEFDDDDDDDEDDDFATDDDEEELEEEEEF